MVPSVLELPALLMCSEISVIFSATL